VPRPQARVHFWFGVITVIYAFDFADRFLVGAILPYLKADFHLNDARAGLLGGIVYLGLALFALPSGALVDRWSRKKMIALMTSFPE
jgi:MFS family permease